LIDRLITQLESMSRDAMENHATQWSTGRLSKSKYQLISQPKLDKFQLQCYSKMFEVMASRFYRATQIYVCATDQRQVGAHQVIDLIR